VYSFFPGLFGSAEWAAGVSDELDDTPLKEQNLFEDASASSEGWSVVQKGLLFFVVLAAIAFYVRWTTRRDDTAYEKTMMA
jgi:hypothetical protein